MRITAILLLSVLLSACGEPDRPTIPLALAVARGDIDQIERHIYWGTNMETPDAQGRRPLHSAAVQGNIVMVRQLLEHGVEVDPVDPGGDTPLTLAILAGRTQTADVLIKYGAKLDPDALLLRAAREGNPDRDVVRYLTSRGANTEARDSQGDTPLLRAVRGNHMRLARHLVDAGADVNATDAQGYSALQIARSNNAKDMAAMLARYGAQ